MADDCRPPIAQFLAYTNGWRTLSSSTDRLWPTDQISWFREQNQDWIDQFLVGLRANGGRAFKENDLPGTLQISQVGDEAVLLLNPAVVANDGEWEAWFFSNWTPGAEPYPSFRELMQAQYRALTLA